MAKLTGATLKKIISECVREELRSGKSISPLIKKYVQLYVPIIVKELVEDTINETLEALNEQKKISRRSNLTEVAHYDDSLRFDSNDTDLLSIRNSVGAVSERKNTITAVPVGDGANAMLKPINPRVIPKYLSDAMNKDYRQFMKNVGPSRNAMGEHLYTTEAIPAGVAAIDMELGKSD